MARSTDVLIIGAGMTGCTAATTLKSMNFQVQVIDKGRGFGGRMATRRIADCHFDHGAQFIKPSPLFLEWLETRLPHDVFKEWLLVQAKKTYICTSGMNRISKYLLENISTDLHIKITKVANKNSEWQISDDDGHLYKAPQLLITAPLPQALKLLKENNISYDRSLDSINYRPHLVLLIITDSKIDLPKAINSNIISDIYDNKEKGLPCKSQALTIITTEKFSNDNFNQSEEALQQIINAELSKIIPSIKIKEAQVKKWKYGLPQNFYSHMYYKSQGTGLYLAGDAFGGASIEGAFRSGLSVSYIIKDDLIY